MIHMIYGLFLMMCFNYVWKWKLIMHDTHIHVVLIQQSIEISTLKCLFIDFVLFTACWTKNTQHFNYIPNNECFDSSGCNKLLSCEFAQLKTPSHDVRFSERWSYWKRYIICYCNCFIHIKPSMEPQYQYFPIDVFV